MLTNWSGRGGGGMSWIGTPWVALPGLAGTGFATRKSMPRRPGHAGEAGADDCEGRPFRKFGQYTAGGRHLG